MRHFANKYIYDDYYFIQKTLKYYALLRSTQDMAY